MAEAAKEGLYTGKCKFCGKKQEVIAMSRKEADEIATRGCDCDGGQRYDDYNVMMTNLEMIIGEPCRKAGFTPVGEKTKDIIKEVADLIFQKKIGKATFVVDSTTIVIKQTENAAKIERKRTETISFS